MFLLKKHPVIHIVSTSTRVMRQGEVEGKDYYYISIEEHMRLRNEGQYLRRSFLVKQNIQIVRMSE